MTLCDLDQRVSSEAAGVPAPELPEGVPALRAFYLYLSTGCNLRCRHCWITPRFVDGQPDPGDVIDVEGLRAAVAEAKTLGLHNAKLTGGEPLLHPRYVEIVDMLTAEGLGLDMETNGTLMTAELAHHLKEKTNVGFISVSIDGTDAATHDAFRGVDGAYEAALRGLDHLVTAGYKNCQVIMSVHHGNVGQMEDVMQLATDHGAASVKFSPVSSTGRGIAMHERGEALDFEELLALSRYVDQDLRARSKIGLVLNVPPALRPVSELWRTRGRTGDCGVRRILGILGSGDIALCGIGRTVPELIYGRLGQDSIRDIWLHHPRLLELRRLLDYIHAFPGICGECTHAKSCRTGCVAHNFEVSGSLVWPDGLCAEAAERGLFPETRRRAA
jgi:SynChlorMet cassette radical SAM/SPASM protein ScmF